MSKLLLSLALENKGTCHVVHCCCCCCCNDGAQILLLEAYEQLEAGQQEQLQSAIKQQLGTVEHLQEQQALREHALQRERERHQVLDQSLRLAQQESAEATAQLKVSAALPTSSTTAT